MSGIKIYWSKQDAPAELHPMLCVLAEEYPVVPGKRKDKDGIQVKFTQTAQPGVSAVSVKGGNAAVKYNGVNNAARAVGTLLAGLESKESTTFKSLGIMLDCSRNAVMTVTHFKKNGCATWR
jgi:hypothetical protein